MESTAWSKAQSFTWFGQQGQGSEQVSDMVLLQCFSVLLLSRKAFLLLLAGIKTVMINNASNEIVLKVTSIYKCMKPTICEPSSMTAQGCETD